MAGLCSFYIGKNHLFERNFTEVTYIRREELLLKVELGIYWCLKSFLPPLYEKPH